MVDPALVVNGLLLMPPSGELCVFFSVIFVLIYVLVSVF